ncbi:MAG: hypothetical protein JST87_10320 [Bacteroidetes bacterium]|nr:hypothetical protein [Bacteroidota bacterium]
MGEKIFINANKFLLTKSGFLHTQKKTYEISKITNFRNLDKPEISKHPLAGETYDYLGFQTEQQVINEMHGDNRLAFDYENKTISFGQNVYSWEFEEMQAVLEKFQNK